MSCTAGIGSQGLQGFSQGLQAGFGSHFGRQLFCAVAPCAKTEVAQSSETAIQGFVLFKIFSIVALHFERICFLALAKKSMNSSLPTHTDTPVSVIVRFTLGMLNSS
jgi:hypothetical protein